MKRTLRTYGLFALVASTLLISSCQKKADLEQPQVKEEQKLDPRIIIQDRQSAVASSDFTLDDGVLHKKEKGSKQIIAVKPYPTPGVENYWSPVNKQYQRNIKVGMVATPEAEAAYPAATLNRYSQALDSAIKYWNTFIPRSNIRFERTTNVTQVDVWVLLHDYGYTNWGGVAVIPYNGKPGYEIDINLYFSGNYYNVPYCTSLIAHEMGHTIGFEHTNMPQGNGTVTYYPGGVQQLYQLQLLANLSDAPGWMTPYNVDPDPESLFNTTGLYNNNPGCYVEWTQNPTQTPYGADFSGRGFSGYDREAVSYVYPYVPILQRWPNSVTPVYNLDYLPENAQIEWRLTKLVDDIEVPWTQAEIDNQEIPWTAFSDARGQYVQILKGPNQTQLYDMKLQAIVYKWGEEIANRYTGLEPIVYLQY